MKELLKKHILSICAIVSILAMAFPFVIVETTMEIYGGSAGGQAATSGFSAIGKSMLSIILIIGPVLIATMNYIKPIEKYKGLLAIAVPVICIAVLIIVFIQVKSASVSASGGGGMVNVEVSANLGIGAIIALISYIGTAIAGAVTFYNFRFDKESLERIKNEGASFAKNVSGKTSSFFNNKTSSPATPTPTKASKANLTRTEEILVLIERLSKMKNDGILTEEEFSEKKKSLLEEI